MREKPQVSLALSSWPGAEGPQDEIGAGPPSFYESACQARAPRTSIDKDLPAVQGAQPWRGLGQRPRSELVAQTSAMHSASPHRSSFYPRSVSPLWFPTASRGYPSGIRTLQTFGGFESMARAQSSEIEIGFFDDVLVHSRGPAQSRCGLVWRYASAGWFSLPCSFFFK